MQENRKLSVIAFADIAGYTALMQADERRAMQILNRFKETLEKIVPAFEGEIVQYFGDGCLLAFNSSTKAVRCAMTLQEEFQQEPPIPLRIGMHQAEVIFTDDNAFGDGVNIASRIESLGIPGAILMSRTLRDQLKNKTDFILAPLGTFDFKNVDEPMEVYALANPGLKVPQKHEMDGKVKKPESTRGKIPYYAAAALIALVAVLAVWYLRGDREMKPGEHKVETLAIFPFFNTSNNSDLDYLTDGIAENLISEFSSTSDIRVMSRLSTFPLKDSIHNLSYIVQLLNVDALLVGNFKEENDGLVLDAELISGNDNSQLWSKKLSGSSKDLSRMERQIVGEVVATVTPGAKTDREASKEIDPEAYQHYMQGRFLAYGSSRAERDQAVEHFHKAIEIEPDYALAYAALANQKAGQARFSNTSRQELLREAKLALRTALNIDPDLPEAHLADANIKFFCDFDWDGAETAFRQALASDPENPEILADFSFFQCAMNRFDEAVSLAEEAIRIDPVSISSMHIIAWSHLYVDPAKSVEEFGRVVELHPNWIWGYIKKGMAHLLLDDYESALKSFAETEEHKGDWGGELLECYLAVMYLKCGENEKYEKKKAEVLEHVETYGMSDPLNIAVLYGGSGDMDKMIYYTKKCIEQQSVNVAVMQLPKGLDFFINDPFADPRYQALLDEMHFPRAD